MGQSLENDRYECDTVSGSKQSGAHGENLCLHRGRDDIAVADSRERDYFVIEVINQWAALGSG